MKKFTVTDEVCVFNMETPWFFINIPLTKIPAGPKRGWGSVPIIATVGKTTWRTSIFPLKKDHYFVPLKKTVRDVEDLFKGKKITLSYRVAKREEI